MKIAILSDSHDHVNNLQKVVDQIKNNAQAVIFCGDLVAPFSAEILSRSNLSTYLCLGNNDEDHIGLVKKGGDKFEWTHLAQEFGQLELAGRRLAFCHYPKLAELLAKTNDYDAVFYGHTHQSKNETLGKCILVNPGAICGIQNGKMGIASYAIYNAVNNQADIITI